MTQRHIYKERWAKQYLISIFLYRNNRCIVLCLWCRIDYKSITQKTSNFPDNQKANSTHF